MIDDHYLNALLTKGTMADIDRKFGKRRALASNDGLTTEFHVQRSSKVDHAENCDVFTCSPNKGSGYQGMLAIKARARSFYLVD